jgi:hypothetical protein
MIAGRELATADISVDVFLIMGCNLLIDECMSWDAVLIFVLDIVS